MKPNDFFELTGKVRAAQKLYYKTRLQGDLIAAKGLESQLDKALKDGLDPEPTAQVFTPIASTDEQRELRLQLDEHIADLEFYHKDEDDE